MSNFKPMHPVSDSLRRIIYDDLGEDADRLENRREIFKQWLECEDHLPKNIDQRLIDNFIRLSKFDIERAKNKFEMWLYSRMKYSFFYGDLSTDELLTPHRIVMVSRRHTEDGYKVYLITFKYITVEKFEFDEMIRYLFLCMEYTLLYDTICGVKAIYDLDGLDPRMIPKINLSHFKTALDIIFKAVPSRINQIHIVNLPKVAQSLYMLATAIMPDKIKQRMILHKEWSTVLDYIKPNSILPKEFGGSDGKFQDLADSMRDFLVGDDDFQSERAKWVLAGEIPSEKRKMHLLDDFGATGSFRQLQID